MRLRRLVRDQRGSALIEFALVSPMVILLIMAALQFGLSLRANAGLRDLAGWAGREAVVSYQLTSDPVIGPEQLRTMITQRAQHPRYNLTDGTLNVTVTSVADTTLLTVNRVRIRISYGYPMSIPLLPRMTVPLSVDRTFYVPNSSTL